MIRFHALPLFCAALLASAVAGFALGEDPIGLQALRAFDPTLTGSGIAIGQVEALSAAGDTDYEVNPGVVGQTVDQMVGKFIYTGTDGSTSTVFPNTVGTESGHANTVADILYGDTDTANPEGVAPAVSEIENFDAAYFAYTIVPDSTAIDARIVNQSFVLDGTAADQGYDNYAAAHNTLFISANGNSGTPVSPSTSYNGIGVAAYEGASAVGPTLDGRSKPDITAPGDATSDSAPLVSGAAVLLLQAAGRGDAGAGTAGDASDARVLKALLLNGAVKPADWTHTDTAPLDPKYGAGILNVYNSYMNLRAGEYGNSGATSGAVAAIDSGGIVPDEGWDLSSITNALDGTGNYVNQSNHYLIDLASDAGSAFTLTSTLTWWRQSGQQDINNLDLYLFDATTGTTISLSDSTVDNVQQLYVPNLLPGQYDLVVVKNGGAPLSGSGTVVTPSETYALAFNFSPVPEPSVSWLLLLAFAALPAVVRRPS